MAVTSDFDRFFLHLPPFDREKNFSDFWKRAVAEAKKIPMEPHYASGKKGPPDHEHYTVTFKGYNRSTVSGDLYIPARAKNPRVVIALPDYNRINPCYGYRLDGDLSFYFMRFRGHDLIQNVAGDEAVTTPGFMVENIHDPDSYYLKALYLDALRVIDVLRLRSDLDCGAVGIIGKGLGAAAAVFAAAQSPRVRALVLDTPSFCYLSLSQNHATSDAAREINEYIAAHRTRKSATKKNLTYFDALNFSDMIDVPVMATVGFKDTLSPPQCVFALFNHLICDKTIEVYPDEGNSAGGERQFRKNVAWLKKNLG